MSWFYRNKENLLEYLESLDDFPDYCIGFVYKITNIETGKFYIGKKILKNTKNVKLGKKEKAKLVESIVGKGRRPSKKTIIQESDWKLYYGSSKPLLEDIQLLGKEKFQREIIQFCYSKKQLSYYEIKHQILNQVLESNNSYNENIIGKYFKRDL